VLHPARAEHAHPSLPDIRMLRLRTTTGLSVLALMLGVAGTSWLSTRTATGYVPPATMARVHGAAPPVLAQAQRRRKPRVQRTPPAATVQTHSYRARDTVVAATSPVTLPTTSAELVPLATPADTSLPWEQLRGHLDGRVLLQVRVDGSGRVDAASVAQSSGDELLDAHALRSVWRWRFAVPEGHPDGASGEVPVRFSSAAGTPAG
jgi:protein TonB